MDSSRRAIVFKLWIIGLAAALVGSVQAAPLNSPQGTDAADRLGALIDGFFEAQDAYYTALEAAQLRGEQDPKLPPEPIKAFLPRFRALAEELKTSDVGAEAWLWTFRLALNADEKQIARETLAVVAERHASAPAVEDLLAELPWNAEVVGVEQGDKFFATVTRTTKRDDTRQAAMFQHADFLARSSDKLPDDLRLRAIKILEALRQSHAESNYGKAAEHLIFELKNLQIGMPAPDFTAKDRGGREFKLSDHRGKVVVLDFWGLWCGPCVAMLPSLKKLGEELAGQPFAIIGINTDDANEFTNNSLSAAGVTWRQAMEGSVEGPITTRWNIQIFPTTYVIDAKGIIRHRDLHGEELATAVKKLVKEAK